MSKTKRTARYDRSEQEASPATGGISHASLYFSETMKGYFRMSETRPLDWSANPSFASLRDYFTNSQ